MITSVAGYNGRTTAYDSSANVYSSSALSGTGGGTPPTGRQLVTRKPVDDRYLAAVRSAVGNAQAVVFGTSLSAANAMSAAYGYKLATCSNGTVQLPAGGVTLTDKVYVDCPVVKSSPLIAARTVVFNGSIAPGNGESVSLPNATKVYVYGPNGTALDVGGGGSFKMHNTSLDASGYCSSLALPSSKAVLFVRNGNVNESNGGSLEMCNTTVIMMGGRADACLPVPYADIASAPAPSQTPCSGVNGGKGNGQFKQTGGNIDWTAPNTLDSTMGADGNPTAAALAAWGSPDGPEDLALWDESAGNGSSDKYQFTGDGTFHIRGIFMVPNADPVSLSGSANLALTNAQFVATSLALASNNTTLSMMVDPNAAVTIPKLAVVGLVR